MSSPNWTITLSREARDDLRDLTLYGLNMWGVEAAERYHAEIVEVIDSLRRFPRMGRRKDGVLQEIRSIGVGQHMIYYRVDESELFILRILHARMDATHHLDIV